jgi:hypothetical protein
MEDSPIQNFPIQDSVNKDSVNKESVNKESVSKESVSPPARPRGPNGSAIVLGLLVLVLGALIIATETANLRVDWLALGPGAIIGVGAVLVLLGAVGLVRRKDQA